MKVKSRLIDHCIPLFPEIVSELRQWQNVFGSKGYVFPPLETNTSDANLLRNMYRVTLGLEGKHSPYGWRSLFSTLARDNRIARDAVELALDHAHDNEVARAYDRGERFDERVKLFSWWGEQLTAAQRGATVIPLTTKGLDILP